MRSAIVPRTGAKPKWAQLNRQVAEAKSLLRAMRETIEDIEDARVIEQAKEVSGQKPRIRLSEIKKEFGFDF